MLQLLVVAFLVSAVQGCVPSVTTVSGSHAPQTVCSGALIFADDFDEFNLEKWQHENTLGDRYGVFQWYNNNRTNSFTEYGILHIRPSLVSDQYGEAFLTSGVLNIDGGAPSDFCTDPRWGCELTGTPTNIINPVKSARIRTVESFSFRYGRVQVRAKMPAGDWLSPAIWMLPTYNAYGTWPASGEINLVESRGNRDMYLNEEHIGTQKAKSSMCYGPDPELTSCDKDWFRRNKQGYDREFHRYQLEWTPNYLKFSIDDVELGHIAPTNGGFWEHGGFNVNSSIENPWRYGTKMAPFDQKFYIVIHLAIGGTSEYYFPDDVTNPSPKPWANTSPTAAADFWNARDNWLSTWNLGVNDGRDASLQVDYVRVWAL